MNNPRIGYFGTWGRSGHFFRSINGVFSRREEEALSRVDLPVFHDDMKENGYCYVVWEGFLGYAIPFSTDDRRPGCVTAIFVEGARFSSEILDILLDQANSYLRSHFLKRLPSRADIPSE